MSLPLTPPPLTGNGILDRWLAALFKKVTGAAQLDAVQIDNTGIAPVTVTTATHTVANSTRFLTANYAGTCTLTLPSAVVFNGNTLMVRTITANTVVSASSNVVPLAGGAAGTAILGAVAGEWAMLVADGTNWQIQAK